MGSAQSRTVHPRRHQRLRPRREGLSGSCPLKPTIRKMPQSPSIPFLGTQKSLLKFKVQTSLCLHFLIRGGRRSSVVRQRKGRLYFICQSGFSPSPPHPPSGSRQTPSELGDPLIGRRTTFKAMGRHSSPRGPRLLPLFWQGFVLTSSTCLLPHYTAKESNATKGLNKCLGNQTRKDSWSHAGAELQPAIAHQASDSRAQN